jgi:hypothetical protein
MLADDFPRERRANSSEQFHRYSPESTLTPLNDTPTVRTSRPSTHALNSTATAECCDADHISEASLPKGQDAASRGQVGAWLSSTGATWAGAQRSWPTGVRTPCASSSWEMAASVVLERFQSAWGGVCLRHAPACSVFCQHPPARPRRQESGGWTRQCMGRPSVSILRRASAILLLRCRWRLLLAW